MKRRVASDTIVYSELRDYAKAGTVLDRVLAFKPDDTDVRFARAWLDIDWKADTRPLHALVETILNWCTAENDREDFGQHARTMPPLGAHFVREPCP